MASVRYTPLAMVRASQLYRPQSMQASRPSPPDVAPIPGIVLFAGEQAAALSSDSAVDEVLSAAYGTAITPAAHARLGSWLAACVISRSELADVYCSDADGITVLFDGYLNHVAAGSPVIRSESHNARLFTRLYREHGKDLPRLLFGSFVGLVLDGKRGQALLFNDRQGSRPLFRRVSDPVSACIAPQTRFLSRIEPKSTKLNTAAIGEFLVRGCFYGTDTLFDDRRKMLPCKNLTHL
jgi:hypothetical protein